MENPWNITSIYMFQYYNCPSCIFKNNSKQEFVNHACEFHPESIDYFIKINDNSLSDVTCPWNEISIQIKEEEPEIQSNTSESIVDIPIIKKENLNEESNSVGEFYLAYKNPTNSPENSSTNEIPTNSTENTLITGNPTNSSKIPSTTENSPNSSEIPLTNQNSTNLSEVPIDKICKFCNDYFHQFLDLHNHIEEVHEGHKNPNACNLCDKSFSRKSDIKKHIHTVHDGSIKDFICNLCQKSFKRASALMGHSSIFHKGVNVFEKHECDHCNKIFTRINDLKIHKINVHGTLKSINKCEYASEELEDSKKHKNSVHEGLKLVYKCNKCTYNSDERATTKGHVTTAHNGCASFELRYQIQGLSF